MLVRPVQAEVHGIGERVFLRVDLVRLHRAHQVLHVDHERREPDGGEHLLVAGVGERADAHAAAVVRMPDRP